MPRRADIINWPPIRTKQRFQAKSRRWKLRMPCSSSWLSDTAGTKMHIRQKSSKMGVDTSTHPRLYPLHTDGNATRRRRDCASLEKRLPQPESLRATAKVVPEVPLFDKCRQKEKRGRRCSCGLAFGSVIDETLAVLRFSSSLFDCESNQV